MYNKQDGVYQYGDFGFWTEIICNSLCQLFASHVISITFYHIQYTDQYRVGEGGGLFAMLGQE